MRLIDADRLIEAITVNPLECPGCPEPEWAEEIVNLIDAMPTVDCINRQAAIDLLQFWSGGYSYIEVPTKAAIEEFGRLQ